MKITKRIEVSAELACTTCGKAARISAFVEGEKWAGEIRAIKREARKLGWRTGLKETLCPKCAAVPAPKPTARPRRYAPSLIDACEARQMRDAGQSLATIARHFGVTRQRVHAKLKAIERGLAE